MSVTNYDIVQANSFLGPVINSNGTVYFVDSVTGSDTNDGKSWDAPLATIDAAIGKCTANKGDVILVAPNHAETIIAAGGITCDIAGISIVGLGVGSNRPRITFGTSTAASILITAASTKILNIIGIAGIDSLTNPIHVQAADCTINIEWRDGSSTVEAIRAILTTAAADRLTINLDYLGFIAGNAVLNAIRLVGCNDAKINVNFYGIAATAVVEFHTTACSNISVNGNFYVSGTTDLSKNVVDTQGASTWSASGFDAAAGCSFSGGSGAAIAKDDLSVVAANVVLIKTEADKIPAEVVKTAAIKVETDKITATIVKIDAEVVKTAAIQQQVARTCAKKTAATPVTQNLFTVAGGAVRILAIVGHITTEIAAGANNAKLVHTSTGGAAVDLCAAADIASMAIRKLLTITGVAANAIALSAAEGVVVSAVATTPLILTPGVLSLNCTAGTTGVIDWYIEYEPLASGATIVPA